MGDHDCLIGNWKGIDFDAFVAKEPEYNMIMVSTYYRIMVIEGQKEKYLM